MPLCCATAVDDDRKGVLKTHHGPVKATEKKNYMNYWSKIHLLYLMKAEKKETRREKKSHELLRQATHFVIVKSDMNGTHTRLTLRYLNNNLFGFFFSPFLWAPSFDLLPFSRLRA